MGTASKNVSAHSAHVCPQQNRPFEAPFAVSFSSTTDDVTSAKSCSRTVMLD